MHLSQNLNEGFGEKEYTRGKENRHFPLSVIEVLISKIRKIFQGSEK